VTALGSALLDRTGRSKLEAVLGKRPLAGALACGRSLTSRKPEVRMIPGPFSESGSRLEQEWSLSTILAVY